MQFYVIDLSPVRQPTEETTFLLLHYRVQRYRYPGELGYAAAGGVAHRFRTVLFFLCFYVLCFTLGFTNERSIIYVYLFIYS